MQLPGRFLDARNIAFESFFAEANTAQTEITHKSARAAALKAAPDGPRRKLRLAIRFYNQ